MHTDPTQSTAPRPVKRSAARMKVKGERNLYYRVVNKRRVYCFNFRDDDGRLHWQNVEGDLEAARAARDDVKRRRRGGEPVIAARAVPTIDEYLPVWLATKSGVSEDVR